MNFFTLFSLLLFNSVHAIQILSKSKLEKCEKISGSNLNCTSKIVINMAVPSESSGRAASIVAELVEVEENSTTNMRTLRIPPVITVTKSAAYAYYDLTYIRDVPYKPEELYVKTRKCEPDAGADVVKFCERLRDDQGHIMEHTQPICCPCGDQRRLPSSCGSFFDKMLKGKANTAHCLRFPGDWFHVFGIGQRSIGFTVQIEVKTGPKSSEVTVGPKNRTAMSNNFLQVNLVGDYAGYTNIPSFDDYYLVIPRQGTLGQQPENLGSNFSSWMLLERVRFTLDGLECNKIGVSYEAFNGQPDFCSSPFWSCLHNQLWNFWDNAGGRSFSIGITEVLNTNLLIELRADDIEFVYQRSPGKIIGITVPTFEALTQFGTAIVTTKNIGEVEASYSLTFDCSTGVGQMEEQFYIMKPKEVAARSFKLYPTTDQSAKYICAAILKDSDFIEVDRAECQFTTTATTLDNGSQIPFQPPKTIYGFFESIEIFWNNLLEGLADFITGKTCRSKCNGFFDFSCHVQYICMSWILLFALFLAIFPTVGLLIWLLHQKGLFDPFYEWWQDHFLSEEEQRRQNIRRHKHKSELPQHRHKRHHKHETRHHHHHHHHHHHNRNGKRKPSKTTHNNNTHHERENDYQYFLHHVHKSKRKHRKTSGMQKNFFDKDENEVDFASHARRRRERESIDGLHRISRSTNDDLDEYRNKVQRKQTVQLV